MPNLFVSLGAACRPAYQLQRLFPSDFISGPFDWTVTPHQSLEVFFKPGFDPQQTLLPEHIIFANDGGVTCSYTKLLFHHGLGAHDISTLRTGIARYSPSPELQLLESKNYHDTRGRFLHTASRLIDLCEGRNQITFLRWIGAGIDTPSDQRLAHCGLPDDWIRNDNIYKLQALISRRFPNLDFRLVLVQSRYCAEIAPDQERISMAKISPRLLSISLLESYPKEYTGDDQAWDALGALLAPVTTVDPPLGQPPGCQSPGRLSASGWSAGS